LDNGKTIETLTEQYEYHKTMMYKALGAIEVLRQLDEEDVPDKEKE
jgi:hypothetical protein